MSAERIYAHAVKQPAKTAAVYNGNPISYAAFASAIDATIGYLRTQDLSPGQTVIVVIRNLLDCRVAVFALHCLGLRTVCMKSTAVAAALALGDVAAVLTTATEAAGHLLTLDDSTGNRVITIPAPSYIPGELAPLPVIANGRNPGGHILYTSGTTGNYKKIFWGMDLQQRRLDERLERAAHFNVDTVYHCADFGLWTAAGYRIPLITWHAGGCVILDQRPDCYDYFLQGAITHAIIIPDQANRLLDYLAAKPAPPPARDFCLMVTSGFISHRLAEQLINRVTRKLENVYGSTETNLPVLRSMVTSLDDLHWLLPTGDRIIEIVDESGNICPVEGEGQLRIRLTELDCHTYLDDPRATAEVFRDGFFYPGDMAVRRADGRIRILGRSADVVNFRGQKYAAAPIEYNIQTRLGASAVCLFSGVSARGEDEVVIAIESEREPDRSDLMSLGHEFAQFDQVRFALLQQFPRTQTGTSKIDRNALRKLLFRDDQNSHSVSRSAGERVLNP